MTYELFPVVIQCMADNGEYEQAIKYMPGLRPLSVNQDGQRKEMLRLLDLFKRTVELQAGHIKIVLAFLDDNKFAGVSDPLVYIRYGQIFLILIFLSYTDGMPIRRRVCSMLVFLYFLRVASPLPFFLAMTMLFLVGGWKRRALLVLIWTLLIWTLLQSYATYYGFPSTIARTVPARIVLSQTPLFFDAERERARQLLMQYPSRNRDVYERTILDLMTGITFAESMQCRFFSKKEKNCMNAREAALVTLKMIEVDRLGEIANEWALLTGNHPASIDSEHNKFSTLLDASGFAPAPFHLDSIEARNRYRANAGIAGLTDSSKKTPPEDMVPMNIGELQGIG